MDVVVVHQLRCRRSHAARHRLLAVNLRAEVVIRRSLVPAARYQRTDIGLGRPIGPTSPFGPISPIIPIPLQPHYLVGIAFEPRPHVVGQVVDVDVAALAEAEDGHGLVVVAHDDEAAVITHVEHIEATHLSRLLDGRCRFPVVVACHELLRQFQRLFPSQFIGPGARQAEGHQRQYK